MTFAAASSINIYWYALPIMITISLVHAASRYDDWKLIVSHAIRLFVLILLIVVGTMALVLISNTQV